MKFKQKNVLVYGLSISGEWACRLLVKKKANVFLYDDNKQNIKNLNLKNCYVLETLNENYIEQFDYIVVSPSIEPENQFLLMAKKYNIKIFSEVEFASQFCKDYVAITGTNGKTTTTELVAAILNQKKKAIACGNIGYALSQAVLEHKRSIKVVEVSSFMLENAHTFSPHVATVLNIDKDHLIRHKTMEEYTRLKMSIFKNLKAEDYAVVNLDKNIKPEINCKILTYSYNRYADVYTKNGYIFIHNTRMVALNELKLKGKHNIYNIMCAICYGLIYKVKPNRIKQAILNYNPEHFRIENIAKVNDINFVNDSKSTNIASTLASTETIKGSIILLLGGSKKGLDYNQLFEKLTKRVHQICAFGEIANDLILCCNNKFKIEDCKTLEAAFEYALSVAKPNDTILLSPASASYDQFKNYIERGKAFNLKVKEYEKSIKK